MEMILRYFDAKSIGQIGDMFLLQGVTPAQRFS